MILLFNALGIIFKLEQKACKFSRGWGFDCYGAQPIDGSLTESAQYIPNKFTSLKFYLFDVHYPLIVGTDVQHSSIIDHLSEE